MESVMMLMLLMKVVVVLICINVADAQSNHTGEFLRSIQTTFLFIVLIFSVVKHQLSIGLLFEVRVCHISQIMKQTIAN